MSANTSINRSRRHAILAMLGTPGLVALGRWFQSSDEAFLLDRRIIISSDDAGMCKAVNEGTMLGMTQGVVTSASIMTCCPQFESFAAFAVANPQYDYGVHLVLTCDLQEQPWGPISPAGDVPSLVDSDGIFHYWPSKSLDVGEAERELRAQIDKAVDRGIRITHLDHHMWVMFLNEELLDLYLRLGIDYNFPVRLESRVPDMVSQRGDSFVRAYFRLVDLAKKKGMPVLDAVEYRNYSIPPTEKRTYFLDALCNLPAGTTEIATHCSTSGTIPPPDVQIRIKDLQFFTSIEVEELLADLRLELSTWDVIQ